MTLRNFQCFSSLQCRIHSAAQVQFLGPYAHTHLGTLVEGTPCTSNGEMVRFLERGIILRERLMSNRTAIEILQQFCEVYPPVV